MTDSTIASLSDLDSADLHRLGRLIDIIWAARSVFAATATFHKDALAFKSFPASRRGVTSDQRESCLLAARGDHAAALELRTTRTKVTAILTKQLEVEGPASIRSAIDELNAYRQLAGIEFLSVGATIDMTVPKGVYNSSGQVLAMLGPLAFGHDDELWNALTRGGGVKKHLAAENLPTELTAGQWAREGAAKPS